MHKILCRYMALFMCAVAFVGSISDARATTPVLLTNLRTQSRGLKPWLVEGKDLTARVSATELWATLGDVRWRLDVDVERAGGAWALESVSSTTRDTTVEAFLPDTQARDGARRVRLEVQAPRLCSTELPREPVVVTFRYRGAGGKQTEVLELDHRCLLGDIVEPSASSYAKLATKYLNDPVIERLVARAGNEPANSPEREVVRLKTWLGFDDTMLRPDPPDQGRGGWITGSAYALSPTETARHGGDCEDWSILIAAYLHRRGLQPQIADTPGHVWVRVPASGHGTPDVDVDLLGPSPTWEPELAMVASASHN